MKKPVIQRIFEIAGQAEITPVFEVSIKNRNAQSITLCVSFSSEVTKTDFFRRTSATFTPCEVPEQDTDFTSKGDNPSNYWFEGDFVVRASNHWGNVTDCHWVFDGEPDGGIVCARCNLAEFIRNDAILAVNKKDAAFLKGLLELDDLDAILVKVRSYLGNNNADFPGITLENAKAFLKLICPSLCF